MESQGELRLNPSSGTSVITPPPARQKSVEQLRRRKQRDWSHLKPGIIDGSECPFCPGHEKMTPSEIRVYRQKGSLPNESGWWVRVIPNLYPALEQSLPSELIEMEERGPFLVTSAFGYHYVIIEMPEHNGSLANASQHQVREVFSMWRDLMTQVGSDRNIQYCFLFKNHGPLAGASIVHPHSQLIALPTIPTRIINELRGTRRFWETNKNCFYCAEIEWERRAKERIVAETENFLAWCLFTSKTPYQVVVSPKFHQSYWANISTHPQGVDQLTEFSSLVREILKRIEKLLSDPDYSFYLHTAPPNQPELLYYHWHLQIEPATEAVVAGFERGSGTHINPRWPEDAARDLREISID